MIEVLFNNKPLLQITNIVPMFVLFSTIHSQPLSTGIKIYCPFITIVDHHKQISQSLDLPFGTKSFELQFTTQWRYHQPISLKQDMIHHHSSPGFSIPNHWQPRLNIMNQHSPKLTSSVIVTSSINQGQPLSTGLQTIAKQLIHHY